MLNINTRQSNKILNECKPLGEYSLFIEAVRRHTAIDKEHGFENAIKECIRNDILCEYLQRKAREVINMLLAEYDYDTDIAVQREETWKIAYTKGKSLGLAEGIERGIEQGMQQGFSDGSRQAKLETARILKQLGDSITKIVQATGLSKAEVEHIDV